MENQFNANQFREDEIVIMPHWDKNKEEWVRTVYPKIGGRLRLAHEDNDNLSITTEIIKYNENFSAFLLDIFVVLNYLVVQMDNLYI